MKKTISLYVHIPFCIKKCAYCDFLSFPIGEGVHHLGFMDDYVDALIGEMALYREDLREYQIKTIFLGGGTPTLLSVGALGRIFEALHGYFDTSHVEEITIEGNPDTITMEKALALKKMGVNRVSLGVQSMEDPLLKLLGRTHSSNTVVKAVDILKEAGLHHINIDLIFGLPHGTEEDYENTLRRVLALSPTHISAYSLTLEEGTPLYRRIKAGELTEPTEEADRIHSKTTKKRLQEAGYHQYEISNFALPGRACLHNKVYWTREPYLGLGLQSHSMVENRRFFNTSDFNEYKESVQEGKKPVEGEEILTAEEIAFEEIMLGLRLMEGVEERVFHGHEEALKLALQRNWLQHKDSRYRLTEEGQDLCNEVLLLFMK